MKREGLLDFDELAAITAAFVDLGVTKVRLTGGEPLVRRNLPDLVQRLARLGIHDLCLTTNGSLLAGQAEALANAGLKRVTVSLDTIEEHLFRRITDSQTTLKQVLAGIDSARKVGLAPVRINMVVQRGVNEQSVIPMASWARREGLELRFIEYMDVGSSNGWRVKDVYTSAEIQADLHSHFPIAPIEPNPVNDTAERFRYLDGHGTLGIIASITKPFCGSCTRARVSSRGELFPCLFASAGTHLAPVLRAGRDLRQAIGRVWQRRDDRYSESRTQMHTNARRPEMAAIGG